MRKSFLMLLVTGIALLLFVTPVVADDTEAAKSFEQKPGAIVDDTKQACYADQDCPYDEPVECEGTQLCAVYPYAVRCDGIWVHCQCAAAAPWCYDPICYCQCKEDGGSDSVCSNECCKEPWPPKPPM